MTLEPGDFVVCFWTAAIGDEPPPRHEGEWMLTLVRKEDGGFVTQTRFRWFGENGAPDEKSMYQHLLGWKDEEVAVAGVEAFIGSGAERLFFHQLRRVDVRGDGKRLIEVLLADPKLQVAIQKMG